MYTMSQHTNEEKKNVIIHIKNNVLVGIWICFFFNTSYNLYNMVLDVDVDVSGGCVYGTQ